MLRLATVGIHHAIADEPVADLRHDADLPDLLARSSAVASTSSAVVLRLNDFQQRHDVGGTEEVQADDILRALRDRRDLVDVERRRVGRKDGAWLGDLIELAQRSPA